VHVVAAAFGKRHDRTARALRSPSGARTTTEKSNIHHQQGQPSFACDRYLNYAAGTAGFLIHCQPRRQVMKKVIVAALATALTLATTAAFAQASGAMASGTMAKEPMSKDTMKKGKTTHSKMKKGSDATGMKHEASGTMGQ
jgi:hypothetical protein